MYGVGRCLSILRDGGQGVGCQGCGRAGGARDCRVDTSRAMGVWVGTSHSSLQMCAGMKKVENHCRRVSGYLRL